MEQASAIEAGMDQYGVPVFRDQHFNDETQMAFSWDFGDLEVANGDLNFHVARRPGPVHVNDISNPDLNNQVLGRDSRRRLCGPGNRLWHSDNSFKEVPTKFSLLPTWACGRDGEMALQPNKETGD